LGTSETDKFKGRVVMVTGASRGIGASIARKFVQIGANVVLNYRSSRKDAEQVLRSLRNEESNRCITFRADVSKLEEIRALVAATTKEFGRIDVLVNNAGILGNSSFLSSTEEEFTSVMDVNLKGPYFTSQQVAQIMLKQKKGSIINISSVAALAQPSALEYIPYVVSKTGLIGLTRALAKKLGPYINVNAICPGVIEAGMNDSISSDAKARLSEESFLKRLGKAEDIANACAFLASEESSFITGEILTVAGGRGMR
jgi:3-oxoacyl-[acyl-carrier protein] reductase